MKTKSKCRTCGERILETGNYSFKLIKAKRVPKKALELIKTAGHSEKKAILSQTKFGRFLMKRCKPTNILDITCGNCSSSSQIRAVKPLLTQQEVSEIKTPTSSVSMMNNSSLSFLNASQKRRRKNRNKELNAGLIIPDSLKNTPNSSFDNSKDNTLDNSSTYVFQSASSSSTEPSTSNSNKKELEKKAVADKEKNMNNLRKILLKSRQNTSSKPNKKSSLKDFLSSM